MGKYKKGEIWSNLKAVDYFKVIGEKKVLVVFKNQMATIIRGKITDRKLKPRNKQLF